MAGADILPNNYMGACIAGGYPAIYHRGIVPTNFYTSYVQTSVEKDVTQLINIRYMNVFEPF
ncbi:hypothetical protein [Sphingobacterium sp. SGR-19]|uniref:hypothetical protein n=1 Tax=Sphingobacterium sp. SGR-19 TaxID=2710886 RepID=UPI001F0D1017|nr:hypothetical protein [Sphingobacterium sp. SGR-19]